MDRHAHSANADVVLGRDLGVGRRARASRQNTFSSSNRSLFEAQMFLANRSMAFSNMAKAQRRSNSRSGVALSANQEIPEAPPSASSETAGRPPPRFNAR